jgi:uncharacterized protein (TIGR00255 family)
MTGFAHKDFDQTGLSGTMQLKSYNNRYLDISISLPPQFSSYEPKIQQLLAERLKRGKVEFALRIKKIERPQAIHPDMATAKAVYDAVSAIAEGCGISEKPSLQTIISFEGVLSCEKDIDAENVWEPLSKEIDSLLSEFETSRKREGKATQDNIFFELSRFEADFSDVKLSVADIETNIKRQLSARFEEVLPEGYDGQRLLQEVAVQLMRFGVNEEVSRLDAHIQAFRLIAQEESPSKKLDFLCQEMNREINTIGSKNMLVPIAHAVVDMKDALENIREQLRNVE